VTDVFTGLQLRDQTHIERFKKSADFLSRVTQEPPNEPLNIKSCSNKKVKDVTSET